MAVANADWVLVRLLDGTERLVRAQPGAKIALGRHGRIDGALLIGLPWGRAYELHGQTLRPAAAPDADVGRVAEYVPATANNQGLVDDNRAQALDQTAIAAMRAHGVAGDEIVKQLVNSSATFAGKTEFAQAKYLKRKRAKYLALVTLLRPTARVLATHLFAKAPSSILELRLDSLAQLLHLANVRAGARLLVVDDVKGLLVGACLERLGGQGLVVAMQCAHDAHFESVKYLNLPPDHLACLRSLEWARAGRTVEHVRQQLEGATDAAQARPAELRAKLTRLEVQQQTRALALASGFDGLVAASRFDPTELARALLPLLMGSASFALFSPSAGPLGAAMGVLRREGWAVNTQLAETWTREIQVLPGRTHPLMSTSAASGFVLSGTALLAASPDERARRLDRAHRLLRGEPVAAEPAAAPAQPDEPADAADAAPAETAKVHDAEQDDDDQEGEDGEGPSKRVAV